MTEVGRTITPGLFFYELRGLQRAAALEHTGRQLESELGESERRR